MSEETQAVVTEAAAPTTDTAAASEGADRSALIAAAEAATTGAGAVLAGDKGEAVPEQSTAAETPAADDGLSKVARVLKAREAAQEARDDAAAAKSEAAAVREEIAQLKAEAKKDREAAASEWGKIQKLKSNPLAAIKEIGWDTRQLVDEVTREGTPEWQASKRLEAQQASLSEQLNELKAWKEERKAAEESYQQHARVQGRQQAERDFLASVPTESALRALYDEKEIVSKAHSLADEYREKSKGQVASNEELRDYLEEQAGKRLAAIRAPQSAPASQAQPAKSVATQPKANGPRALSAASASERRTSPKPRHEWSPDEERDAMKAAAEAAMRGSS